jgi:SAM-dependent methyltransferase
MCPICDAETSLLGAKTGTWSKRTFHVHRCPHCAFTFVADPWTDFAQIYGDDYYAGCGADPLVDYVHEIDHRDTTIRRYEWRGILNAVRWLTNVGPGTRWLDFGCGTGGLVTYLRETANVDAVGFEEGWSVPRLQEHGVPLLTEEQLDECRDGFDVVSAIEVIEHVPDPVAALRRMANLLRPGGLLFLTTGNASSHRDRLLAWRYLTPEIHVSLFEPRTLAIAMERAGLLPEFPGFGPGWADIIRFKTLKNLGRSDISAVERLIPWSITTRLLDRRYGLSAHPVGRAVDHAP